MIFVNGINDYIPVVAPNGVKIYVNNVIVPSGTLIDNNDKVRFELVAANTNNTTVTFNLAVGDIANVLSKILKDAGISHARWHDLRHTFASMLLEKDESVFVISKLLGHKSIKTTERYLHLRDQAARNAISSLDGAFPSQSILVNKGKDKKAA